MLFVVDTRRADPLDQEVARRLRYVDAPVLCVANKTDDDDARAAGRRVLPLRPQDRCRSARTQNRGKRELMDEIQSACPTTARATRAPDESR